MKPTGLFDLTGRVAAVIGGTGVLGGAVAEGLAAAGASVAVLGRSNERGAARVASITDGGGKATAVQVEATDLQSIRDAATEVEKQLGPVDILVNSVGVNSSTPFFDIDLQEWHRLLDANLTSAFLACQVFGRAMVDRGAGGSIVNISSASSGPPLSRVLTYSIAKAGINNLTQYLALELAPNRIRVNAIAPGFFPAEQNRKILQPERVAKIMAHTPMDRFGEARELIGATLLLASDKAGSFITGEELIVDGGFHAMAL
jgi:NAD(P)-dependent dehydrogenase (short-subunit alcohol dehydrogenase family)